jgi:hypothetical protein
MQISASFQSDLASGAVALRLVSGVLAVLGCFQLWIAINPRKYAQWSSGYWPGLVRLVRIFFIYDMLLGDRPGEDLQNKRLWIRDARRLGIAGTVICWVLAAIIWSVA